MIRTTVYTGVIARDIACTCPIARVAARRSTSLACLPARTIPIGGLSPLSSFMKAKKRRRSALSDPLSWLRAEAPL